MESVPSVHRNSDHAFALEFHNPEEAVFRTRKSILLAEDDNDLRYVMEHTLTSMGYLVVAAGDAYTASAAFRAQSWIDLLLTDYDMPGRTGVELARELTALRPALPVMLITGSILQEATLSEINDRRWTYVRKPCHLGALEANLKRVLKPGT